ncbi:MAG: DEAD/DEAH box helicase [Opitutaceae bacterium]|nr:DEAD/DEAH box helicase [Opitutaceae bacterium]
MLVVHLPPNLAAAIQRDAVPLRVEIDLSRPPGAALLPALALLQRWCGTTQPPKFIQLSRAQLRELATAAGSLPVFAENGRPGPWRHAHLLVDPVAEKPTATAPSPRRASSRDLTPATVDGSEHFLSITLPSREHPGYGSMLDFLKTSGFSLEPSNRKWWLRDRHKVLNLLAEHGHRLRENFDIEFTPGFTQRTAHIQDARVNASVKSSGADFVLDLDLQAGDSPEAAVRDALATGRNYIEHQGRVYLFDQDHLARLAKAQRALSSAPQTGAAAHTSLRISRARVPEAQAILDELSPHFQPTAEWDERSHALRELTTLPPAPMPPELAAQLRPYQRLGVAWLWYLHRQNLGGVLADEMGLGKTLQALALFAALPRDAATTRLVVVPASLLENWRRESARFTPQLRVFVHHGNQRLRGARDFAGHDLVITSYGTLARDRKIFAEVAFACAIADEAQHIKNRHSQNASALRTLRATTRFVLTGTPLENSFDDLRSLFAFLMPGLIEVMPAGARGEERDWHDQRLRQRTAPYILRRTKQSVAPELPDKIEQVLWCEPTPGQAALYREWQEKSERELIDLAAGGASEGRLRMATLTQLLRLRQICCDPRLVAPASPAADSTKLEVLRELLEEAVDDGHRVLVFSQFTSLLALLRPELDALGLAHCYLDGSMSARDRQTSVDQFQNSPDIPLFLLSLKAGGTGLNLTGADTVVHLDPWWNPAVEAQATDRAHRIGQNRTVTSYKLICGGTVEEKVLALHEEKRVLLAGVFEASDAASAKLSLADLRSLLS